MDLSKPLEGLSLEAMLTRLRARIQRQRWHVASNLPTKAREHQHPCLPEVTTPPNAHLLVFREATYEGNADHAAGADPPGSAGM